MHFATTAEMPISAKRFTEYKFRISDLIQRRDWEALVRVCATEDYEQKKSIAAIFSLHDPANVWRFVRWASSLPADKRRENREGISTVCLILGKVGQTDTDSALSILKKLLSDDHMLRAGVEMALSNLWVLDSKKCGRILLESWIRNSGENDDLEQVAVLSSGYLLSQEPSFVAPFLEKVLALSKHAAAADSAAALASKYDVRLRRRSSPAGSKKNSAKAQVAPR